MPSETGLTRPAQEAEAAASAGQGGNAQDAVTAAEKRGSAERGRKSPRALALGRVLLAGGGAGQPDGARPPLGYPAREAQGGSGNEEVLEILCGLDETEINLRRRGAALEARGRPVVNAGLTGNSRVWDPEYFLSLSHICFLHLLSPRCHRASATSHGWQQKHRF